MGFSTWLPPDRPGGVGVAFTDRTGGVSRPPYDTWNLGHFGRDDAGALQANYARLLGAIGCDRVAVTGQVHGTLVRRIDAAAPGITAASPPEVFAPGAPEADAMITRERGVGLVIRVADCVPVLLADPAAGVIAAAHAGRTGLLAGVLLQTVAALRDAGAGNLTAWIGPHVCPACYEVPRAMAEAAWDILPATRGVSATGTPAIDLGAGAAAQLAAAGVDVHRLDPCTACDPRFFSHRRDRGQTGRQAGVIWLETSTS